MEKHILKSFKTYVLHIIHREICYHHKEFLNVIGHFIHILSFSWFRLKYRCKNNEKKLKSPFKYIRNLFSNHLIVFQITSNGNINIINTINLEVYRHFIKPDRMRQRHFGHFGATGTSTPRALLGQNSPFLLHWTHFKSIINISNISLMIQQAKDHTIYDRLWSNFTWDQ